MTKFCTHCLGSSLVYCVECARSKYLHGTGLKEGDYRCTFPPCNTKPVLICSTCGMPAPSCEIQDERLYCVKRTATNQEVPEYAESASTFTPYISKALRFTDQEAVRFIVDQRFDYTYEVIRKVCEL